MCVWDAVFLVISETVRRRSELRMLSECQLRNPTHTCVSSEVSFVMASLSRIARCGAKIFSAGTRATAAGRGSFHHH